MTKGWRWGLLAAGVWLCGAAGVQAGEAPLLNIEQFNREWEVKDFPEVLVDAQGVALFRRDLRVELAWEVSEAGRIENLRVIDEAPVGKGYADIIVAAFRDSRLVPRVAQPTVPARVTATIEFAARPGYHTTP